MSEPIITALKASHEVQAISGNTHTSAMIALGVPDAVAQRLVVPGGHPAQEMHVTLAFYPAPLGEPDAWDTLAQVLKGLAAATEAPVCHLGGSGRFLNVSEGKDACILNVDAPGINELRQACVHVAERLGLEHSRLHSFTPHLTVSYEDAGTDHPMPRQKIAPFAFTGLELWVAGHKVVFPFAPVSLQSAIGAVVTRQFAKADAAQVDQRRPAQALLAQLTGDLLNVTNTDRHLQGETDRLHEHHARAFEGLTRAIPAVRGSELEEAALHHAGEMGGARRAGA